ncbi:hydroxyacid dehydrogenase [Virgibacillus sp. W0181]|uniref:hydroxyacid dehydrogenase n=1 Tax=Virgibacillus sp. W0181 TaxID=3391581 RepID=UPI003F47EB9B
MNKTVYIPLDIEKEGKEYLIQKGYQLKIADNVKKTTLVDDVGNCDAILTRSNAMIDADVIKAGKDLKVIAKYGVGLNNIDVEAATKQGVYVTNTPEANANDVAEHAMSLILNLSKKLMIMDKELRNGNFDIRNIVYSESLEGKTLGIIGLGRIGKLTAKKACDGFNMKVLGYDPHAKHFPEMIKRVDDLKEILQKSDVISLHLPLLESTKHIISTKEFKLMKESAFFINTSRGGTVDELALVEALKSKEIAGAGLDVFEMEPPDTNAELFTLNNIIVTPHSAALSKEGSVKMAVHAAMQIDQVLNGQKPSWPVNTISQYSYTGE